MANTKISNEYNIYFNNDSKNVKITYDANTPLPLYYNEDCSNMFQGCRYLKHNIQQGPSHNFIKNMFAMYSTCYNLTGSPVCGDNVTDIGYAYQNCNRITGSPVCGDNVIYMYYTYDNCYNLTGSPVCGDNVTEMWTAYRDCHNLTGSPVCGNNVNSMGYAYDNCYNLTGSPVCGDKVTDMNSTYKFCYSLTGSPVCGNNVIDMNYTYQGCYNITGSPVIGSNVVALQKTYYQCYNLSGPIIQYGDGSKFDDISESFYHCPNVFGTLYMNYSTSIPYGGFTNAFYGHNNSHRINLYVLNKNTYNDIYRYNNTYGLLGKSVTWTNINSNCFYSATDNVYVGTGDCTFKD